MTCPNCNTPRIATIEVESNLTVRKCAHCQGIWIPSFNYFSFLKDGAQFIHDMPADGYSVINSENDSDTAKICPDCGKIV